MKSATITAINLIWSMIPIIKTAYEENPLPETPAKKRGRKKKGKVLNLICRLDNYKESVCLFIKNLSVPLITTRLSETSE